MLNRIKSIYVVVLFLILATIMGLCTFFLIHSLLCSTTLIGGLLSFINLIYSYLCIGTYSVIIHGAWYYILCCIFYWVLFFRNKTTKKYLKHGVLLVTLLMLWFEIKNIYLTYINGIVKFTDSSDVAIAKAVAMFNKQYEGVFLNVLTIISLCGSLILLLGTIYKLLNIKTCEMEESHENQSNS